MRPTGLHSGSVRPSSLGRRGGRWAGAQCCAQETGARDKLPAPPPETLQAATPPLKEQMPFWKKSCKPTLLYPESHVKRISKASCRKGSSSDREEGGPGGQPRALPPWEAHFLPSPTFLPNMWRAATRRRRPFSPGPASHLRTRHSPNKYFVSTDDMPGLAERTGCSQGGQRGGGGGGHRARK